MQQSATGSDVASKSSQFAKELVAGGVAGCLSKSAVAPLERVKILLQTGRAPTGRVSATLASIYANEGVLGFFRGNGASVYRIIPYAAFHFYAYEQYRAAITAAFPDLVVQRVPPWMDFVAGGCAGATAVLMTYPLDVVRTRLAWTTEMTNPLRHARHTVSSMTLHIIRQDGLLGLYRGLSPTLLGVMPYAGLKFYTYQRLKGVWHSCHRSASLPDAPPSKPPLHMSLLFGGIAGLVGQTATYPLDVVRRRMQVEGARSGGATPLMSTWGHLKAVWRQGGVRALFQGLAINYMKVVPQTAIGFTAYDAAKSMLGLKNHL